MNTIGIAQPPHSPVAARMARMHGRLHLAFGRRGERTSVVALDERAPLRALRPTVGAGDRATAVVVNTSGGLVGGDTHAIEVEFGRGARARVVGQAQEKAYRSDGTEARVDVSLDIAAGAEAEYLPLGTILFDGARLRRIIRVRAARTASALAGDIVTLGRVARGERFSGGSLHDEWRLERDGRLEWADAVHLGGDALPAALNERAGFAGAEALGTVILATPGARQQLPGARSSLEALADQPVRAAVSAIDDNLVVGRFLGEARAVRRGFAALWQALRAALGWPGGMPRLWSI